MFSASSAKDRRKSEAPNYATLLGGGRVFDDLARTAATLGRGRFVFRGRRGRTLDRRDRGREHAHIEPRIIVMRVAGRTIAVCTQRATRTLGALLTFARLRGDGRALLGIIAARAFLALLLRAIFALLRPVFSLLRALFTLLLWAFVALRAIFAIITTGTLIALLLGAILALLLRAVLARTILSGPILARLLALLRLAEFLDVVAVVALIAFVTLEAVRAFGEVALLAARLRIVFLVTRARFAEHAEIMVCILKIDFGQNPVTRLLRIARERFIFFEHLRRVSARTIVDPVAVV